MTLRDEGAPRSTGRTQYRDTHGQLWSVYEYSRLSREGTVTKILVFDYDAAIRCVRTYPADWRELPASALEELSWRS